MKVYLFARRNSSDGDGVSDTLKIPLYFLGDFE
jgi:hypothetical protein